MVCDNLLYVRATIEPETFSEIHASPEARQALAAFIKTLVNQDVRVNVYGNTIQFACGYGMTISLTADGINVSGSRSLGTAEMTRIRDEIKAVADELGAELQNEKIEAALMALGEVEENATIPGTTFQRITVNVEA